MIPRGRRRPWTGFLRGQRIRRLSLVRLPSGEVLSAYSIRRGKVLVVLPDTPQFALRIFDRYNAEQVQRHKLPEAVLMGTLKKGCVERRSLKKLRACRANGRRPVKPGSRPRGRPRKAG